MLTKIEEKGMAEDGTVRWHHRLNGREFEQTLADSGGQRSLGAAVHGVSVRHDLATEQQLTFSFNSKYFLILLLATEQQPPDQGFVGRVIHISKKKHICLSCRSSALDYLSQKSLLRIFLRRWWNFGGVGIGRGTMLKREIRGARGHSRGSALGCLPQVDHLWQTSVWTLPVWWLTLEWLVTWKWPEPAQTEGVIVTASLPSL